MSACYILLNSIDTFCIVCDENKDRSNVFFLYYTTGPFSIDDFDLLCFLLLMCTEHVVDEQKKCKKEIEIDQ